MSLSACIVTASVFARRADELTFLRIWATEQARRERMVSLALSSSRRLERSDEL